jgi:hypothetical protein
MIEKIKVEMALLGWDIQEIISNDGWGKKTKGYSIWFKRSDWHGKFTYSITGHEVCFHGHTDDFTASERVLEVVHSTADMAKKAWEDFPYAITYQTANGEVRKDIECIPFVNGRDISVK